MTEPQEPADPPPPDPEPDPPRRRTRFRRPGDYVAVAVVVVVVVVTFAVVRQGSDAHNTVSQTYRAAVTAPADPAAPPPSLAEVWRAPSGATPRPVASGGTVVTGDGGQVTGRDPLTGAPRWHYDRDLPLCTVTLAWSKVLTLFRKGDWCSETTSLVTATGARSAQRNGDVPVGAGLVNDGSYVTSAGEKLLTTVRSDLVQTMEFGSPPDPNTSGRQPRLGCTYRSVAADEARIAVVENCGPRSTHPDNGVDRFTVYESTNQDADRPRVDISVTLPGSGARVVAATVRYAAVALPNPARLLVIDQDNGAIAAQYPLRLPAADLAGIPPGRTVQNTVGAAQTYWFTGSSIVALDAANLRPRWSVPDALGPAALFAGRLLVPVPGGLDLRDAVTGARLGFYPVNRGGYRGGVAVGTLGPVVLEQRGATLVALR